MASAHLRYPGVRQKRSWLLTACSRHCPIKSATKRGCHQKIVHLVVAFRGRRGGWGVLVLCGGKAIYVRWKFIIKFVSSRGDAKIMPHNLLSALLLFRKFSVNRLPAPKTINTKKVQRFLIKIPLNLFQFSVSAVTSWIKDLEVKVKSYEGIFFKLHFHWPCGFKLYFELKFKKYPPTFDQKIKKEITVLSGMFQVPLPNMNDQLCTSLALRDLTCQ